MIFCEDVMSYPKKNKIIFKIPQINSVDGKINLEIIALEQSNVHGRIDKRKYRWEKLKNYVKSSEK